MIPKGRKIEAFEEIENLNDSSLRKCRYSKWQNTYSWRWKALAQLGIKLQKFNGVAIASNFQGKEKYLQDMGFVKNGGNWSIEYVEKPSQIQAPKNVEPKKKIKDLLAQLLNFLVI